MAKLQVGQKLPNFSFINSFEQEKSVEKDVLGKKTVFYALRYIGCTMCRYDVHVLAQKHAEFVAKGAQLFVVMQSDPAVVREDLKDAEVPFDIVCDPEMKIYKKFEILPAASMEAMGGTDKERLAAKFAAVQASGFSHGKYEGDELQLPAVWVVEADGTLSFVKYAESLVDIPTADELLEIL